MNCILLANSERIQDNSKKGDYKNAKVTYKVKIFTIRQILTYFEKLSLGSIITIETK